MLLLRFDRQSCFFAKPESPQSAIATSAKSLIQNVLGENNLATAQTQNGFNDLSIYINLRARDGCIKVALRSIVVTHSDSYCMGVRAIYQLSFLGGRTTTVQAPKHVYNGGFYSYHGGLPRVSRLELEDGEYLAQIRTRQGEVTDQITFVTNLRTVSFGGSGGDEEDLPVDLSQRIVAFVGTSAGVLERLGAVSTALNWETVGHVVLLRALIEKSRAYRIQKDDTFTGEEAVVQSFIMDAKEDIFKRTLSFLLTE